MYKTLDQLLEEPIQTPPFVVWPLLPKGGKLFVYAPKKHFKSMLLFNLLYDLSTGKPFFGKWEVKEPKTVLLIEQEIGWFMCKNRLDKIHRFRGDKVAGENVRIVSKNRNLRLDTPEGLKAIEKEIEDSKAEIVAFDPIRKLHRQDENDSTAITKVVDAMDYLVDKFGVTLIIAHHSGHPGDRATHMRGSSVWHDEADTVVNLSRPVKTNNNLLRITVEDTRHTEPPAYWDVRFIPDTHCFEMA